MGWYEELLPVLRNDRVVLASIGLAAVGLIGTMITTLTIVRDEAVIPPVQPKTRYITQDTEDSLGLDTLEKLLDHSSYSVKEIATKILCDRAVNSWDTIEHLLHGITRPDYDERMQCLRALALLTGQTTGFDGLSKLNQPKAYSALVRSLELSLADAEPPKLSDHHWDEYYLRDMAERFCLMFVLELINKYGANQLVKANFVEKWLAKQDWGETPEDRRKNFAEYTGFKNNRIVDIVNRIRHCRRGLRALENAGLTKEVHARRHMDELPDVVMTVESDVQDLVDGASGQATRMREQSSEEQRLRRQHREAMVLNDGTRPLGRDDIIERDHGSPT